MRDDKTTKKFFLLLSSVILLFCFKCYIYVSKILLWFYCVCSEPILWFNFLSSQKITMYSVFLMHTKTVFTLIIIYISITIFSNYSENLSFSNRCNFFTKSIPVSFFLDSRSRLWKTKINLG